jgi:hypothetical protein
MSTSATVDVQELLARAMTLEPSARAQLANELLASLDGEPELTIHPGWEEELTKRAQAAMSEDWEGEDWSVVRERLKPR